MSYPDMTPEQRREHDKREALGCLIFGIVAIALALACICGIALKTVL